MIKVDFKTEGKRRFVVDCPFAMNHWVKSIPGRKFLKRTKVWEIPPMRKQREQLRALADLGKAELTEQARTACNEESSGELIRQNRFPGSWPHRMPPRALQVGGLDFLWARRNGGLFCDMGTGKSKMIVDWALANMADVGDPRHNMLLIFCPIAIRDNWMEEIEKHRPETIPVATCVVDPGATGFKTQLREFLEADMMRVAIVGYESLQQTEGGGRAFETTLSILTHSSVSKYWVAADESHRIQNIATNTWKNCNRLAQAAQGKVIATGTEDDGNPLDLYGQFEFLDPDIIGFGDYHAFKSRYTIKGGFEGKQVIGYSNLEELMAAIRPHVYVADKADFGDLPDKIYMPPRLVELSAKQKTIIKDLTAEGRALVEGAEQEEVKVKGTLALYTAIQQVCAGHISTKVLKPQIDPEAKPDFERVVESVVAPEHNPKIKELMSIAPQIKGKCLVWCKYRKEIEDVVSVLNKHYPGLVYQYHGGLDREQRAEHIRRFKTCGKWLVLMTSLGGTGLTLNEATYSVYMSNTFKSRDRKQSEDRNHRIGQEHPVVYNDLVANCKVEKAIVRALASKKDLAQYIREQIKTGGEIF